jgi:hypothetical protein
MEPLLDKARPDNAVELALHARFELVVDVAQFGMEPAEFPFAPAPLIDAQGEVVDLPVIGQRTASLASETNLEEVGE